MEFEWKTSIVCPKKVIEFNNSTCKGTFKGYDKELFNIVVDMNTMLNINEVSFCITTLIEKSFIF